MNIQQDFKELFVLLEKHNEIDGLNFPEAKKHRVQGKYGDLDIYFNGKVIYLN